MAKKYLVFKEHNGERFYKRTKTLDYWTLPKYKDTCWKYSKQGAKQLVERLIKRDCTKFYNYGFEEVE